MKREPLSLTAPTNDYVAIDEQGNETEVGSSPHVVVLDRSTGLEWLVAYVGGRRMTIDEGIELAATINVLGGGWHAATQPELCTLRKLDTYNPCIDTAFFPDTRSEWHVTSSPAPWSPAGNVLVVNFSHGNCFAYDRNHDGWVRAVRSRGRSPGQ